MQHNTILEEDIMKKIDQFINQYPLSKTLRFQLIPVGDTQKNFELNNMLQEDEQRAEHYAQAKRIIDGYHRHYIDSVLSDITSAKDFDAFLENVRNYADLYGRTERDKKALSKAEETMRKFIASALQSGKAYKYLFKQELIKNILPEYLDSIGDAQGKETIGEFIGFSTYFTGFFNNRKNMYSAEEKSTAIAYRCINENLPKFLDNIKVFKNADIANVLADKLVSLNADFSGIYNLRAQDIFSVDYFPFVLSQQGIETYNSLIGGYTNSDGTKVQGLNEYINLYNQKIRKSDKDKKRIPKLKPLFKQILSEKGSISFIPEKFESDDALLKSVNRFYLERKEEKVESIENILTRIRELFSDFSQYDLNGIFVKNGPDLTTVCSGAFGYWGTVKDAWSEAYDARNKKKDTQKYIDTKRKAYNGIESFSLADIQRYADSVEHEAEEVHDMREWIKAEIGAKCDAVIKTYAVAQTLLEHPYTEPKKLFNNEEAVARIKNALDAVKEIEHTMKLFGGTGKEVGKDESFYGEYAICYERLCEVDDLYNKVRNYMTQKPYKTDKIKLNFQNPQFLGGWDRNKESDYSAVMLKKGEGYYIAIMDSSSKKVFEHIPAIKNGEDKYEKIVYKLLPGPNKMLPKVFFSKKGIENFNPPADVLEKYNLGTHKTGTDFNIDDCHRLIDYFKSAISVHPDWSKFDFHFSDTATYRTIADFYNEVKNQGYKISFCDVPVSYIDSLLNEGKIYLFQIYNKDFSEHSKGTPNLHTLYFKMLFDERNLKNVVFKLNGESEMFYRKASIAQEDKIVHPKNQPIKNKNENNQKKTSTFDYDITKDYRYTVDRFMLHIPITLNFTAGGNNNINLNVRQALKNSEKNYIIGIDRGERNLLYISVIDSAGKIHEQFSLNEIINEHKGNTYHTDYHALLDAKEKERLESRVNWKTVENIKELKEGYISQVVHKICQLVEKYDAIIVMEDLNFGFKRVRGGKFEKSVYQKFEKMLIDKLNYCADKAKAPEEIGSVLNAYQLTNKFDSFKSMGKQNGFIFYVPAFLTSKIDPTTGFADFLHPHYQSVATAQMFIGSFDSIAYNNKAGYFEFALDYDKFPKCTAYGKKKWTLCTYGNRIKTFRNPAKNNEWDNREINLTATFTELFEEYGIDINGDIKAQAVAQTDKKFFERMIKLISLTLQMRNSETGNIHKDYLISPVKNGKGEFYYSENYKNDENAPLPKDADANGAYNIAKKGLWVIEQFKKADSEDELAKVDLKITNAAWMEYAQANSNCDA